VQELHDFSARRPAAPPGRRCFRRVLLCGAGGSKSTWAEDARAAGEPPPLSLDVFATATRRPFEAGQWVSRAAAVRAALPKFCVLCCLEQDVCLPVSQVSSLTTHVITCHLIRDPLPDARQSEHFSCRGRSY